MNRANVKSCSLCKFNCSIEEEIAVCEIDDETYAPEHKCKEFIQAIGDRDIFEKEHLLNI